MQSIYPLVAAVVTAVLGIVTWVVQKRRERFDKIQDRKLQLYDELVSSIIDIYSGNMAPFVVEAQRAWIYASDEVVKLIQEYCVVHARETTHAERAEVLGKVLLAMRKDMGYKTSISEDWLRTNFQTITASPEKIAEYQKHRMMKSKP